MKYRIRFHLAKGENYKKWQVKYGNFTSYYDPEKIMLVMRNCKLKNNKSLARKIYAGANKSVCAWIEADDINITSVVPIPGEPAEVSFNPKSNPFWICKNEDVDNKTFSILHTIGRKVVCPFLAA